MRKIKFRYRIEHATCSSKLAKSHKRIVTTYYFSLEAIESGMFSKILETLYSPKIISRDSYVGLKDEGEKEIYEGDIIKYIRKNWYAPGHPEHNTDLKETCLIYWDDGKHGFCNDMRDKTGRVFAGGLLGFEDSRADENIIEKIGSIYENPELLKETK